MKPPEAVTVKFARGDPERNQKYRERSFDYQKKMQEEEPWLEARFNQMKVGGGRKVMSSEWRRRCEAKYVTLCSGPHVGQGEPADVLFVHGGGGAGPGGGPWAISPGP